MAEATTENETRVLEDIDVNVKLKLAASWTAFMIISIYIDLLGFYKTGVVEDILIGRVFTFDITWTFIFIALSMMIIPSYMIFMSVALPARVNRWANIVVGIIFVPLIIFNVASQIGYLFNLSFGDSGFWPHYYIGAGAELILLALIIWYAWKWPKTTRNV